jgi:hypothetical protein
MDDFTFDPATPRAVPEPATIAILTLGLVGFGLYRKKRNI